MDRTLFQDGDPGRREATVAKGEKESGFITDGSSNDFARAGTGGPGSTRAGTQRGIKSRQAQMLAIGGTIGAYQDSFAGHWHGQ